jgi:D-alanine-D-alanine ligase
LNFNSNILIEEYITWRDISITYVEWIWITEPIEYLYPKSTIYDYKLKSIENDKVIVKIAENINRTANEKLFETSKKIVELLDINWYCRIDYRVDENNNIYFLELNAQVSFHPDWAFVWWWKSIWCDFSRLVNHIIEFWLNNERKISKYWVQNF